MAFVQVIRATPSTDKSDGNTKAKKRKEKVTEDQMKAQLQEVNSLKFVTMLLVGFFRVQVYRAVDGALASAFVEPNSNMIAQDSHTVTATPTALLNNCQHSFPFSTPLSNAGVHLMLGPNHIHVFQ